jgi:hypothetical protein
MQYWTLDPPKRWQAGHVGADKTPLYFSCADCGEKDATIAGIASTDGTFQGIGIIKASDGFFGNPAMFCQPCFDKRLAARDERKAG